MYVYKRLREVRVAMEKSQEEIARILNMTRQQYGLYESGRRELPMRHFVTLARFYYVTLDYLAGLSDSPRGY